MFKETKQTVRPSVGENIKRGITAFSKTHTLVGLSGFSQFVSSQPNCKTKNLLFFEPYNQRCHDDSKVVSYKRIILFNITLPDWPIPKSTSLQRLLSPPLIRPQLLRRVRQAMKSIITPHLIQSSARLVFLFTPGLLSVRRVWDRPALIVLSIEHSPACCAKLFGEWH